MAEENTEQLDDIDLKIGVLNPEAVQIESEDGSVLIDFDPNQSTAEPEFGSNLAEFIDESSLDQMAGDLIAIF